MSTAIQTVTAEVWVHDHPHVRIEFTQRGRFSMTGALGAYQGFWHREARGDLDMRAFLARCGPDYIANKIDLPTKEDCPTATLQAVKESIVEDRRGGWIDADTAREWWDDAVDRLEGERHPEAVTRWLHSTSLDEAWEHVATRPTTRFQRFESVWKAFREALRADIEQRPWSEVDPEAYTAEMAAQADYTARRDAFLADLVEGGADLSPRPPPWGDPPPSSWDDVDWPSWVTPDARGLLHDSWRGPGKGWDSYACHHPMGAFVVSVANPRLRRTLKAGWYLPRINNMAVLVCVDGSVTCVASFEVEPWAPPAEAPDGS